MALTGSESPWLGGLMSGVAQGRLGRRLNRPSLAGQAGGALEQQALFLSRSQHRAADVLSPSGRIRPGARPCSRSARSLRKSLKKFHPPSAPIRLTNAPRRSTARVYFRRTAGGTSGRERLLIDLNALSPQRQQAVAARLVNRRRRRSGGQRAAGLQTHSHRRCRPQQGFRGAQFGPTFLAAKLF